MLFFSRIIEWLMRGLSATPEQMNLKKKRVFDLGDGVKLEMVLIPAGTFMMGSPNSGKDPKHFETYHQVTISKPFYLGKYTVTQAQWLKVTEKNPSLFQGGQLPVEGISWDDAMGFCVRLKEKFGESFRLPTEAEWEYACRAGTTTPYHFGDKLNGTQANCDGGFPYGTTKKGPYLEKTSPVGIYRSNAWGLFDMHGNVWEWCEDWYDSYPFDPVTDPRGPEKGSFRVSRGGCWSSIGWFCRSALRSWNPPDRRSNCLGFRLALDSSPVKPIDAGAGIVLPEPSCLLPSSTN